MGAFLGFRFASPQARQPSPLRGSHSTCCRSRRIFTIGMVSQPAFVCNQHSFSTSIRLQPAFVCNWHPFATGTLWQLATLGNRSAFATGLLLRLATLGRVILAPHESFVVFYAVLPEEGDKLILETRLRVVFFLPGDVLLHLSYIRLAHAEGGVSRLPGKSLVLPPHP